MLCFHIKQHHINQPSAHRSKASFTPSMPISNFHSPSPKITHDVNENDWGANQLIP